MGSKDFIKVHYEGMDNLFRDLNRMAKQGEAAIQELVGKVTPGLSTWSGDARQAFDHAQRTWQAKFADMTAVLNAAALHISTSNENYQAMDRHGASLFH